MIPSAIKGVQLPPWFLSCKDTSIDNPRLKNRTIVKEKWYFFQMNGCSTTPIPSVRWCFCAKGFSTEVLVEAHVLENKSELHSLLPNDNRVFSKWETSYQQKRTSFTTKWQSGLFEMEDFVSIGPTHSCKGFFKIRKWAHHGGLRNLQYSTWCYIGHPSGSSIYQASLDSM